MPARPRTDIQVTVSEKFCPDCKTIKPASEFYKMANCTTGLKCYCKSCQRAGVVRSYQKLRENILSKARSKFKENPGKYRATRRAYALSDAGKAYERKRYPEKLAYMKIWLKKNQKRLYLKRQERYKTDIAYHVACKCRHRIAMALSRRAKGLSKSDKTIKLLGCTFAELKCYIESKFTQGMSWQNVLDAKIHLDHIRPISSFNLLNHEEQLAAFNYMNLQPLWAHDNYVKSDKWEGSYNNDLQAYPV